MDVSSLFEPARIGTLELPNRIVMAPMTRQMSPSGMPGPGVARYYARRAAGGVGLIITEGTAIDHRAAQGYPDIPHIFGRKALAGWKGVVGAVHAGGAKILCQLWHVGGYRKPGFDPERRVPSFAPSALHHPGYGNDPPPWLPEELTSFGMEEITESFARAARNAEAAGFDGVEIHGAHGYLIDQFFWTRTNKRDDAYGGPLENRVRFAKDVVTAVRGSVGKNFLVGFRFSQWKLRAFEDKVVHTPEELTTWLSPLAEAGVDVFHASTYLLDAPEFPDSPLNLAGWTQKLINKPTISIGKVGVDQDFASEKRGEITDGKVDLAPVLERLRRREFELVAVGRALIGDPDWPLKIKAGRFGEIRPYDRGLLASLE